MAKPLHDGLILLPTRRAARGLAAAFLHHSAGRPILLPRIIAIGGIDEAPLALAGALELPPAITPAHRNAALARLIRGLPKQAGGSARSDAAWKLATELASLMDEAERAEIDLGKGLVRAVHEDFAQHWNQTLTFLRIVTEHWPAYLAEQGLMNPAARQVALLDIQAASWRSTPPKDPVLVVGNAGDIPAIGRFLHVVANMAGGAVVLPGLDRTLDETAWEALDETHPQYGLRALLVQLGATRSDVRMLGEEAPRAALLRTALLPAAALASWLTPFDAPLAGLARLHPADAQDEAVCIAMILRNALESPTVQVALVTPDRGLAERVTTELGRWGVLADDSAGEALNQTPPAVFLRLLAAAVCERLAPVPLLALLKHPLAAAGLPSEELRRGARLLEHQCLRGPPPLPGLAGLRRAVNPAAARDAERHHGVTGHDNLLETLLTRLEYCLAPVLRAMTAVRLPPADLLVALITAAEAMAATGDTEGPTRLWAFEEGEALANLLAEMLEALAELPPDTPACLPALLEALLAGAVVRSRRATRGRGGCEHPRVFIWGLLEARLQSADVIVLGGLTEGTWPPATDPGPWMSRPMRARAGLPSPETRLGQAAHDFCMAACAAPVVILSAPRRRDATPSVPSRWLIRLEALLQRHGGLPSHPAVSWAAMLDQPPAGAVPADPPRPRPPVAARPRRLAVTDIGTLLRDPYELYARRILRLRELDPLEQSADFRDYGSIVHKGLDTFLREAGVAWPEDAARSLTRRLHQALRDAGIPDALIAWWSPRLSRIGEWVDAQERTRRLAHPLVALEPEAAGEWAISRPGGVFVLRGRADRIERRADGGIAILDYKTGTLPTKDEALLGREPQLLLEGAMAQSGAFGGALSGPVAELTYWRLTGDHKMGEARTLLEGGTDGIVIAIEDASDRLATLIDKYDDPATTYPAQPIGGRGRHRPYAQLSRAAEWGVAVEDADGAETTET